MELALCEALKVTVFFYILAPLNKVETRKIIVYIERFISHKIKKKRMKNAWI